MINLTSARLTSKIFSPSARSATANFNRLEELISFMAFLTYKSCTTNNVTIVRPKKAPLWLQKKSQVMLCAPYLNIGIEIRYESLYE